MKVTINIDCTPEEARSFLGLPDVQPLQATMLKEIEERMKSNLSALDPDTLFKTWVPASIEGLDQMQKIFWGQMMAGGQGTEKKEKK